MTHEEVYDVTIIGGGPAGLYSAFYSGLRQMKTKIIEFQPSLGGKLHVYPEKVIWDVGGQPPIQAEKFRSQLVEQGMTFDPTVVCDRKVTKIERQVNGMYQLTDSEGEYHFSKTVIVAVGSGILKPHKLKVDDAEKYEMKNLNYTIKSLERFRDKVVMISGGGNSAIDWANELEPIAKKVYVTCRKDVLKGHEASVEKLMNSSATCLFNTCISKLIAEENQGTVNCVEVSDDEVGEIQQIDVDEIIVNHGYEIDTSLLQDSDVSIDLVDQYFIDGSVTGVTSEPGIFAAGDILKHDGKLNLIAGCFQDAANAINQAKQFIAPEANQTAMVSSHNDVFKEKNKQLLSK
ncbi:NAD(P)/FAD-dependent oxidoreductase [Halalkalibacillus halophilus]|uniref:NAD(P)/FAD-dependent oxidoreductase n=1 Tax=Halalkalibacillus halophilus TaxID=392827 RepID=UPI000424379B|nr:NAD(P)/FAD-dependent oxidoreductase [Halalkalibacillus halophilus]